MLGWLTFQFATLMRRLWGPNNDPLEVQDRARKAMADHTQAKLARQLEQERRRRER